MATRWAIGVMAMALGALARRPLQADENVLLADGPPVIVIGQQAQLVAPAAAADNANAKDKGDDDPQVVAFRQQFTPPLKAELSFAIRVCKLSDDQRRKLITASKGFLRQFARDCARAQNGGVQIVNGGVQIVNRVRNGRGVAVAVGGVPINPATPQTSFEAAMADLVRKNVTSDQRTAYDAELSKRQEFRREVAVENIVAQLDDRLDLSADQRQKIASSLSGGWNDSWAPPLQVFVQMNQYVPMIPDERILPHLTAEQKTVWSRMQKVSFGQSPDPFQGLIDGGAAVDDVNLDDQP